MSVGGVLANKQLCVLNLTQVVGVNVQHTLLWVDPSCGDYYPKLPIS